MRMAADRLQTSSCLHVCFLLDYIHSLFVLFQNVNDKPQTQPDCHAAYPSLDGVTLFSKRAPFTGGSL